ncbi:MAG: type II CAAX prenyl endopeptidase Rce1 family protein [Streptococcus sp.]
MITTAFLQEILFRKWIFTWLAPYSKTAVLVSTGLFVSFICQLILPISLFISEWD